MSNKYSGVQPIEVIENEFKERMEEPVLVFLLLIFW